MIIFLIITIYDFLTMFCSKLPVEITMSKGIGCIYKYDHRNCPYPYPNTTFVITPRFDTSIQTQRNSDMLETSCTITSGYVTSYILIFILFSQRDT